MRQQVVIVGEDLGTVEPVIRETLEQFGVLSYRLFYFEKGARGEFRRYREYPEQALVSSTTHDLPTLAGLWIGEDIEARRPPACSRTTPCIAARCRSAARRSRRCSTCCISLELLPAYSPTSAARCPK